MGNSESYSTFKSRLEKLPDNVVVIGSHTQNDNRKEKVLSIFFLPFTLCSRLLLEVIWFPYRYVVVTSWWFILHKVRQQSNCSFGLGFPSKFLFCDIYMYVCMHACMGFKLDEVYIYNCNSKNNDYIINTDVGGLTQILLTLRVYVYRIRRIKKFYAT